MIPRSNLMLDPLVALLAGSKVGGPSGSTPQIPTQAALFGDILGLLGNFNAKAAETLPITSLDSDEQSQSGLAVADLFGQSPDFMTIGLPVVTPTPGVPVDGHSATQPNAVPLSSAQTDTDDELGAANEFARVTAAKFVSPESLKSVFAVSHATIAWKELPHEAIPEGAFRVLASKISGNQLELQLISDLDPDHVLKLTLPMELMQAEASEDGAAMKSAKASAASNVGRVSLVGVYSHAQPFDELLGKLQVSEITLTSEPAVRQSDSSVEIMKMTLTALQPDGESRLVATVPKAQVRILISKSVLVSTQQGDIGVTVPTGRMGASLPEVAFPPTGDIRIDDPKAQATSLSSTPSAVAWEADKGSIELLFDTKSLQPGVDRTAALNRPVDTPPVKVPVQITLPELQPNLTSGTRTLTVKLEPEHLGPARLHLSVVNDTVSARLSVDTTAAKVAVERSLDQLTDQLSRAGIKVNYIEVSLRGGSHHEAFHRQANWFRPQRYPVQAQGDDPAMASLPISAVGVPQTKMYLSTYSVNLFA